MRQRLVPLRSDTDANAYPERDADADAHTNAHPCADTRSDL